MAGLRVRFKWVAVFGSVLLVGIVMLATTILLLQDLESDFYCRVKNYSGKETGDKWSLPYFCSLKDEISYDHKGDVILRKDTIIKAKLRRKKAYLAIGMTTVERKNQQGKISYLSKSLQSLLQPLHNNELDSLLIIVLVGEMPPTRRSALAERINIEFGQFINSGIIQLIQVPSRYYVPLASSVTVYNDSISRLTWRSKQNLDYSFLFEYAFGLSEYYMHMEDDVIANSTYFKSIRYDLHTLGQSDEAWTMLDYSRHGFIGKLMKNKQLRTYSKFIRTFYQVMPCDFLYQYVNFLATGNKYPVGRLQSILFHHVGTVSSSSGT